MAIYEADEISFEVPDGYIDRTVNLFMTRPDGPRTVPMSIVITRDPRTEEPVREQAMKLLKQVAAQVTNVKILGQRDRQVGALAAREARLHGMQNNVPTYTRQTYVGYYRTMLSITVTTPRGSAAQCDALTERLLDGMRFKKIT